MEMTGYMPYFAVIIPTVLFYLMTGGFGWLIGYWKPDWKLFIQCYRVPLHAAHYVLVKRQSGEHDVEEVVVIRAPPGTEFEDPDLSYMYQADDVPLIGTPPSNEPRNIRYFTHRFLRFIYDERLDTFKRKVLFGAQTSIGQLHDAAKKPASTGHSRDFFEIIQGKNVIDIPVKPYHILFVQEVLDPFYIFQLFAVSLWFYEFYIYYAVCIVVISGVSITINLRETRRNLQKLHDMVIFSGSVIHCRKGTASQAHDLVTVDSSELLPGDVFEIPADGLLLSCDAVLMVGGAVVNESMLTGESVPVTKVALPPAEDAGEQNIFNIDIHKSHVLFCGTQVIQTRSEIVRAMAIRTGFSTAKGQLVRSIMFPKPAQFRFYSDSYKFIGLLACLGLVGFIYSVIMLLHNDVAHGLVVIRAFDLVTTVSLGLVSQFNKLTCTDCTSRAPCCHDDWNHLCNFALEKAKDIVHQPSSCQCEWQIKGILLRQDWHTHGGWS